MSKIWILATFLFSLLSPSAFADDADQLARELQFEVEQTDAQPAGWAVQEASAVRDGKVVHGGKWSVRIDRVPGAGGEFTSISKSLPIDFDGATISIKAFLRTEKVSSYAGLWLREDGKSAPVAFGNMQSRHLKGNTAWQEYTVTLPLKPGAKQLVFGALVVGSGTAWVDDVQLLVDDKPIWQAPKRKVPETVVDTDHEFDGGSRMGLAALSPIQIENLALLGKVWGFLKYHHPVITSGRRQWDYDLFRIMPQVLAASDRAGANEILDQWLRGLGALESCRPCAALADTNLYMSPSVSWINDSNLLGAELSADLQKIYVNRAPTEEQFYVTMQPRVNNPKFLHELDYQQIQFPDAGFQLLALFRFWNIIEYWSPYRDLTGEDWDAVLRQAIPSIANAKNSTDFQLALMAVVARLHDSHTNLWSSLDVRPPTGACDLPYDLRFIEYQLVVTAYSGKTADREPALKPGDVIVALDGAPVSELITRRQPYYAASNDAAQLRDMARNFTRGECTEVKLDIQRGSQASQITARRLSAQQVSHAITHDRPGETFQLLPDNIAYLKLSSIKSADIPRYLEAAKASRGLIIDIRNYPSEYVVYSLGAHLVEASTEFTRVTIGDIDNPGAFHWTSPEILTAKAPHYPGKVMILVDEVSQSQAEYTTMAFRSAPHVKVIGSTTAGADGDVSNIPLPGGFRSMISGIGIFYPDKRATQRIGIIPDIEVRPSIAGIRDGRDEVLETAFAEIKRQ